MRIEAALRHEQMKLKEQLLRVQAAVLISNGVDTGHEMQDLLKRIEADSNENGQKLAEYHDLLRNVRQAKPVVRSKSETGDHG